MAADADDSTTLRKKLQELEEAHAELLRENTRINTQLELQQGRARCKILLVRHGERLDSTHSFDGEGWLRKTAWPLDSPLSPNGREQAHSLAESLRTEGVQEIYCSPFTRAVQTALPLGQAADMQVHRDFGLAELISLDYIEACTTAVQKFRSGPILPSSSEEFEVSALLTPVGVSLSAEEAAMVNQQDEYPLWDTPILVPESMPSFERRVVGAARVLVSRLRALMAEHGRACIVVVTHATVLRALVGLLDVSAKVQDQPHAAVVCATPADPSAISLGRFLCEVREGSVTSPPKVPVPSLPKPIPSSPAPAKTGFSFSFLFGRTSSPPTHSPTGPKWTHDKTVSTCAACDNSFSVFVRKHHCRSCGKIFCDQCSGHRKALPELGMFSSVRVCLACFLPPTSTEINCTNVAIAIVDVPWVSDVIHEARNPYAKLGAEVVKFCCNLHALATKGTPGPEISKSVDEFATAMTSALHPSRPHGCAGDQTFEEHLKRASAALRLAVEDAVVPRVFSTIFAGYVMANHEADVAFKRRALNLRVAPPFVFGVDAFYAPGGGTIQAFVDAYSPAIRALQRLPRLKSPLGKLACVRGAIGLICDCASSLPGQKIKQISADDLVPAVAVILVQAAVSQIEAEVNFLSDFINDSLCQESEGYALATLETALRRVQVLPADGDWADQVVVCVECESHVAKRKCNTCCDPLCVACFRALHLHGARLEHTFENIKADDLPRHQDAVLCEECSDAPATRLCGVCSGPFCAPCFIAIHSSGQRAAHPYSAITSDSPVFHQFVPPWRKNLPEGSKVRDAAFVLESRDVSDPRINKYRAVLARSPIVLDELADLARSAGVPNELRPRVWSLLSGILPRDTRAVASRTGGDAGRGGDVASPASAWGGCAQNLRRDAYAVEVNRLFPGSDEHAVVAASPSLDPTLRKQVQSDVDRTNSSQPFFKDASAKACLLRSMLVWADTHPSIGFVQGMTDLAAPIMVTLMCGAEGAETDKPRGLRDLMGARARVTNEAWWRVEADVYWMADSLFASMQGILTVTPDRFAQLDLATRRATLFSNEKLLDYLDACGIELKHFAMRWAVCLLMREVPLSCGPRVIDAFIGTPSVDDFLGYMFAAVLVRYSDKIMDEKEGEAMLFLQHLPTETWTEEDMSELVRDAEMLRGAIIYQAEVLETMLGPL